MSDDTTPTAPPTAIKPGIKTSEMRLALLAVLLSAAFASGLIPSGDGWPAKAALFVAFALTSLGYSVSRGLTKGGAS